MLRSIIFGQILGVFAEVDPQVLRSRADRLAGLFFAVACVGGFGAFFEMSTFAYAAEAVARRLRADALRATLRQDPEFYDLDINSAGALTSAIGDRAEKVHLFFTNAGFLIQVRYFPTQPAVVECERTGLRDAAG
jgi:ATP-binding cassette subfamily B (MDR/TAP) protein 1